MKSYASLVPEGCSTTRKDGLYAEYHPNGQLAHLGLYDDGVPRPETWQLYVDEEGKTARVERRFELAFAPAPAPGPAPAPDSATAPSPEDTDPALETWLRDKIDKLSACAASKERRCSFCQRGLSVLFKLIDGVGVTICDGCVRSCVDILKEDARAKRRWWQLWKGVWGW